MKKCPYCGTENKVDATTCIRCFGWIKAKEENEKPKEETVKSQKQGVKKHGT